MLRYTYHGKILIRSGLIGDTPFESTRWEMWSQQVAKFALPSSIFIVPPSERLRLTVDAWLSGSSLIASALLRPLYRHATRSVFKRRLYTVLHSADNISLSEWQQHCGHERSVDIFRWYLRADLRPELLLLSSKFSRIPREKNMTGHIALVKILQES